MLTYIQSSIYAKKKREMLFIYICVTIDVIQCIYSNMVRQE